MRFSLRYGLLAMVLAVLAIAGGVAAKKKATFPVLDGVSPFVRCDVCDAMVDAAVEFRDELVANATRDGVKLTEEAVIETSLEHLCNPHTTNGDWLRRLHWTVDVVANTVTFDFKNAFGRCKRMCWTGADICEKLMASEDADDMSGLLYSNVAGAKIRKAVCSSACRAQRKAHAVAQKRGNVKMEWGAEAFEPIEASEKEVEEMMERMVLDGRSGPGMDVFSRDEMRDLRGAMASGDFDRVQELDPTFADMDREDFDAMRGAADAVARGEHGEPDSPPEKPLPAAEEVLAAGDAAADAPGGFFMDGIVDSLREIMRRIIGG